MSSRPSNPSAHQDNSPLVKVMIDQPRLAKATDGVLLAIPSGWTRSALVTFTNERQGEDGLSVVVRRECVDPRVSLKSCVDSLLVELARVLPGFVLDEHSEGVSIGSRSAECIIYTWVTMGVRYRQVHHCAQDIPGNMVHITLSCAEKYSKKNDDLFSQILSSVTFAEPDMSVPYLGR